MGEIPMTTQCSLKLKQSHKFGLFLEYFEEKKEFLKLMPPKVEKGPLIEIIVKFEKCLPLLLEPLFEELE